MTPRQRLMAAIKDDPSLIDRMLLACESEVDIATCPEDGYKIVAPHLVGFAEERLVCVALNRRNRVIDVQVLTQGSDRFTVVDPAQILRWVLTRKKPASGFLLAHNHPSGDPTPSAQDRDVTHRVNQAARVIGLVFNDHIIVGAHGRYRSMKAQGDF